VGVVIIIKNPVNVLYVKGAVLMKMITILKPDSLNQAKEMMNLIMQMMLIMMI
jgi:hypothetical protein